MFKTENTYYFLKSSHRVAEDTVRSCTGGSHIVKYGQGKGIRLLGSRLYKTLEDAEAAIPGKTEARGKTPYSYM